MLESISGKIKDIKSTIELVQDIAKYIKAGAQLLGEVAESVEKFSENVKPTAVLKPKE